MDNSSLLAAAAKFSLDESSFGRSQRERLVALLSETDPTDGTIERLAATSQSEGGYHSVDPRITSNNFPTTAWPSIEGGRLDSFTDGHRPIGRRDATVAEGMLYGMAHPEEMAEFWIWCFERTLCVGGEVLALVLADEFGERCAILEDVDREKNEWDRILTFPMTAAELAARDAEDAEAAKQRNA